MKILKKNIKNYQLVQKLNNSYFVNHHIDLIWFIDFHSSNFWFFKLKNELYGITDERYYDMAIKKLKNIKVLLFSNEKSIKIIIERIKSLKIKEIFFDYTKTTYKMFETLQALFGKLVKFIPFDYTNLREIKTKQEIILIKKSCKIADEIFANLVMKIKIGDTELEVKRKLVELIASYNLKPSFDPIIAFGANAAVPHWKSSNTKLVKGKLLLVDFGVFYEGYASDMTRMIAIGKQDPKLVKIYDIVVESLNNAIKAIRPELPCNYIDGIARNYIAKNGYGNNFIHGLGHGYGLEIHESPYFKKQDTTILKEGMTLTVEPGIYLSNKFGIRVENDIVVTKNGCKVLNKTSTKLIYL